MASENNITQDDINNVDDVNRDNDNDSNNKCLKTSEIYECFDERSNHYYCKFCR